MKKLLQSLFILAFTFASIAQAQISKTSIGSSWNMYTVLTPSTNPVHVNDGLGTISFAHRQNAEFPGGSGVMQTTWSEDGGLTWGNYILQPTNDSTELNYNRYPSGLIVDPIGDGLSMGFRSDRAFSNTSGMAIGAEQLVHFDDSTDTGRDLYVTFTKGWWRNKNKFNQFPLDIATAGFATGKMAEGNIKGLCSDLFGGSGTETAAQRRLCWAPVFTLSRVFNQSFSTFFEYNSRFFLLGTSLAPFEDIPIRGTLALMLSDHIDNYKLNDFGELNWVFNISLGF